MSTITGPAIVAPSCRCNVPPWEHCAHTIAGSSMLKFWVVVTASHGSKLEFAAIGESSMDVTIDMAEQYPQSKVEVRPL